MGDMTQKRDKIEIVAKILDVCRTPKSKTRIVYACNLNFHTVVAYLDLLQERKLLEAKKEQYKTTNNGIKAYMLIMELGKLLGLEI